MQVTDLQGHNMVTPPHRRVSSPDWQPYGPHNPPPPVPSTREVLLPASFTGNQWVTVCNDCESVIVNAQAHVLVCPNRKEE